MGSCAEGPSIETVSVECQGVTYTIRSPIRESASGAVVGQVMLRCPISGVQRIVAAQWWSTALGASGALLFAFLLAVFASRRLSLPLGRISAAAERLAEGDFSVRVLERGSSEVAALAGSVNWSAERLSGLFSELSTEREKLADVLSSMAEGVLALSSDRSVTMLNEPARDLLGVAPDAEIGAPLDHGVTDAAVRGAMLEGTGPEPLEVGGRWLHVRSSALSGGEGAVSVIVDVTEPQRLDRVRREFVANASHQLRSPLTSIRGYLEAVSDGTADTPEVRARCLATALDHVALLQRLIDQLLQLSRLQAGAAPLEMTAGVALREVALQASALLQRQAGDKGVDVSVEAETSNGSITGSPDLLVQAVHNMLDNAIRHSPAGGAVTVRVGESEEGLAVSVHDRGPGIDGADPDLLWERFHGASSDGSSGLGLAIAKEIVRFHGGSVFARPNPGGGAVFGFTLPA